MAVVKAPVGSRVGGLPARYNSFRRTVVQVATTAVLVVAHAIGYWIAVIARLFSTPSWLGTASAMAIARFLTLSRATRLRNRLTAGVTAATATVEPAAGGGYRERAECQAGADERQ